MDKEEFNKYVLIGFLIIIIYLSFTIIKPFISALLISSILAYLGYPLYKKLMSVIKNDIISALIVTILIIIIFLLPIVFIANSISKETINIIKEGNIVNNIQDITSSYFKNQPTLSILISDSITKVISYIKIETINFLFNVPSKLISLFISILALFYFLILGEKFVDKIRCIIPIKKRSELVNHIKNVTDAIIYGLFLTAIIQFIISLLGFKLLGIHSPFLFALMIGIAAFIPFIGPVVIWLPIAFFALLEGDTTQVVGLIIIGIILNLTEHFIKAKVAQIKANVHPIVVILGALGGISIFGAIGFIVGPIILSSFIIILNDYFNFGGNKIET